MIDILDCQVELILMMLPVAAILCAAVCQYPLNLHPLFSIPGNDPVIEEICCDQSILPVVKLNESHLRIGIDEGLLLDTANTLEVAHIVGVLRSQVSGMESHYLPLGFLLLLGPLQCLELLFRENKILLGGLGFQCFQTLLERLQVMAQPHTPNPTRRNKDPSLLQLV